MEEFPNFEFCPSIAREIRNTAASIHEIVRPLGGELRLNRDEELTQSPEEPSDALCTKQRRERFDELWYGNVGRRLRYAAFFAAIFLLIVTLLMGIEQYIR